MPLDDPHHDAPSARFKRGVVGEALGASGLVHFNGAIDEEWLAALQGKRGVAVYREMRDNDSTVGASLHLINNLVRKVQWTPVAAGESPEQIECAEFLESCMGDMSSTWTDYVSDALSMLPFGWSAFEKVYKVRNGPGQVDSARRSRFSDGRIGWRRLAGRAQETLDRWAIDDDGGIRGFYQVAAPKYREVFLPIEKLLLFRTENSKGNPEGRSILRSSYRSWYYLKRMQEIEAIGIERDLVGLPKMELPVSWFSPTARPEDKAQIHNYMRILSQVRRNEYDGMVVPSELNHEGKPTGFKFSLVTSGGSRQLDPSVVVQRYETRVAQGMFTQFMFLGMNSVGTQALSTDLTDVFVAGLSSLLDIIEDTHHRFGTAELLTLNGYKPDDWARIQHGEVTKKDMRPIAEIVLKLVQAGALTPDMPLEEYLRSELRLPEMDEETRAGRETADPADRKAAADRLANDDDEEPAEEEEGDESEDA